jgi:S1-C subfamily serine protease
MEVVTLDVSVARRMGIPEEFRGAAVTKVEPDSPMVGLFRPLDVVHSIGGRPVQTADEVIQALASRRTTSNALEFGVYRLVEGQGTFQASKVRVP